MVALMKPDNRIVDTIIHGDALEVLRTLDACSVDAIVTDPPSAIHFMGKEWDSDKGGRTEWIGWLCGVMRETLRVLKPGGHALIWALPRTSHWTATAIEDAGFEIRDVLTHLFGSGFPKSMDISKAIDRMAGAEREVVGRSQYASRRPNPMNGTTYNYNASQYDISANLDITAPSTPEAQQWQGHGTALKPANEHWILARKPLSEKSIAANVLKWGTGGLNIDQCRVQASERPLLVRDVKDEVIQNAYGDGLNGSRAIGTTTQGRFPANLLLSHSLFCTDETCTQDCPIAEIDRQSGITSATGRRSERSRNAVVEGTKWGVSNHQSREYPGDTGGASRYFTQFCYTAKASRAERNRGCEGLPEVERKPYEGGMHSLSDKRMNHEQNRLPASNHHPTVKPLALCKWLIRLICREGGVVLDPFCGSGSILISAIYEHCHYIGVEQEASYVEIARARVRHAWEVQP